MRVLCALIFVKLIHIITGSSDQSDTMRPWPWQRERNYVTLAPRYKSDTYMLIISGGGGGAAMGSIGGYVFTT